MAKSATAPAAPSTSAPARAPITTGAVAAHVTRVSSGSGVSAPTAPSGPVLAVAARPDPTKLNPNVVFQQFIDLHKLNRPRGADVMRLVNSHMTLQSLPPVLPASLSGSANNGTGSNPGSSMTTAPGSAFPSFYNALLRGETITADTHEATWTSTPAEVAARIAEIKAKGDSRFKRFDEWNHGRFAKAEEQRQAAESARRQAEDRARLEQVSQEVRAELHARLGATWSDHAINALTEAVQTYVYLGQCYVILDSLVFSLIIFLNRYTKEMLQQLIRVSRHRSEAYKYQHDHRKLFEPKGVLADLDRLDTASAAAARGGARDPFAASNALKRAAASQVATPPPEEDEPMSGTLRVAKHRVV
jgi:hypothetical protein